MPPSLLDMPNNVLFQIAENTNFVTIQILRKVCHDLRNFIDDTHPTVPFKTIAVCVSYDLIKLFFSDKTEIREIKYIEDKKNCQVKTINGKYTFKKSNFFDIFKKDFDLVLASVNKDVILDELVIQRTIFPESEPFFIETLEKLQVFLESKNHKLKIKMLTLKLTSSQQALLILKNLEPGTLKTIVITDPRLLTEKVSSIYSFNINEIVNTEQWKKAKELKLKYFVSESVGEFLHFEKADFSRFGTTLEDLLLMKKTAQETPNFNCFVTTLASFNEEEQLMEELGDDYAEDDECYSWFYSTLNPEKVVAILYYPNQLLFNFAIFPASIVTDNNFVLNH